MIDSSTPIESSAIWKCFKDGNLPGGKKLKSLLFLDNFVDE